MPIEKLKFIDRNNLDSGLHSDLIKLGNKLNELIEQLNELKSSIDCEEECLYFGQNPKGNN